MSEQDIDALRERWEAEYSPALTLELAGEHRLRNELERALEVLTAGLEAHPEHVAARVAKGRCHLDLGQPDEAGRELGRVLVDDPSHLLANRLMAQAHLELGELGRARDRLGLFALLGGEGDELDQLESRLLEAMSSTSEPESEPDAGEAASEPFELPSPVEPRLGTPTPAPVSAADPDPFVLLDWIEFDESRYAAALYSGELFARPGDDGPTAREVPVASDAAGAPAAAGEPAPTLTLAELYRKQGHHEEAAGIFREILRRQPGNVEAARALGEIAKQESWPLTADDLLAGAAESEPAGKGRTVTELLRRYRDRLRSRE